MRNKQFNSLFLASIDLRLFNMSPLQDKLEHVLDLSRQQMEQYQEKPTHAQKIAYQQRLLQEDLVAIRAQISCLSTVWTPATCICVLQELIDHLYSWMWLNAYSNIIWLFECGNTAACMKVCMCVIQEMMLAWDEYSCLERSVEQLRAALQAQMNHNTTPQVRRAGPQ